VFACAVSFCKNNLFCISKATKKEFHFKEFTIIDK
jgi:hypothetical protein